MEPHTKEAHLTFAQCAKAKGLQVNLSVVAQSVDLSCGTEVHAFGILHLPVMPGVMNLNV